MGIPFGLPRKFGLPSLDSLPIDQLYNNYFKNVNEEENFICAVIKLCSDFNTIMPGKHYVIDLELVKAFYNNKWMKEEKSDTAKSDTAKSDTAKSELIKFMVGNIKEYKPSPLAMICTGLIAPFGAITIKKTGEKIPQLKRFRIDLVPNFVVVPTVTLISLVGVRIFNLKKGLK